MSLLHVSVGTAICKQSWSLSCPSFRTYSTRYYHQRGAPRISDANGKGVVVFLDVVGFVGDPPAVSHILDVRGPIALAPCPWCSFLRDDNELHRGSRCGFLTSMNARHSSFTRCKSRAESFR
jgi:hypothetical protein